jgi:SAM-dependent methyltransferase
MAWRIPSPAYPARMLAARVAWLADRRAAVLASYDAEAPGYGDDDYPAPMQPVFVDRLVATCPADGIVLDAPCGTGRYFDVVTRAGRRVVGIDQSAGMLARARGRGLAQRLEQVGLQELRFDREFDAVMTVDAMENVPPEDWPLVLANLHRALRPGGHLYLTVEEIDVAEIDAAFADAQRAGLPAVHGEVIEGDTAGYHYYPGRARVDAWLSAESLAVVAEATDQQEGWAYHHLLVRDASYPDMASATLAGMDQETTRFDGAIEGVHAAPADDGRVELIVRRPAVGERELLDAAELDLRLGLVGDRWAARDVASSPVYLDAQLTVINTRLLAAIEPDRSRWAQAGDQLYVDLDLSVDNLPAGSRLAVGSAVIEISETPHTGCAKFSARFGSEALRWINGPDGRANRLRGLNARIVGAGTVHVGDAVRKV